jgi:hypothetical protein
LEPKRCKSVSLSAKRSVSTLVGLAHGVVTEKLRRKIVRAIHRKNSDRRHMAGLRQRRGVLAVDHVDRLEVSSAPCVLARAAPRTHRGSLSLSFSLSLSLKEISVRTEAPASPNSRTQGHARARLIPTDPTPACAACALVSCARCVCRSQRSMYTFTESCGRVRCKV